MDQDKKQKTLIVVENEENKQGTENLFRMITMNKD
jgi:hypothetical protein